MIEINREKSIYTYRQNPFNARIIDRRLNRHGARWATYASYATEEKARAALLAIETGRKRKEAKQP